MAKSKGKISERKKNSRFLFLVSLSPSTSQGSPKLGRVALLGSPKLGRVDLSRPAAGQL